MMIFTSMGRLWHKAKMQGCRDFIERSLVSWLWAHQKECYLGYWSLTWSIKPFEGEHGSNKWLLGPWRSKGAGSGKCLEEQAGNPGKLLLSDILRPAATQNWFLLLDKNSGDIATHWSQDSGDQWIGRCFSWFMPSLSLMESGGN